MMLNFTVSAGPNAVKHRLIGERSGTQVERFTSLVPKSAKTARQPERLITRTLPLLIILGN